MLHFLHFFCLLNGPGYPQLLPKSGIIKISLIEENFGQAFIAIEIQ